MEFLHVEPTEHEIKLLSLIATKKAELATANLHPTAVAVHTSELEHLYAVFDLRIIRMPELERGTAYLLV